MSKNDGFMLAEFKGTYRAPHPEGIRDQNVVKPFHVQVEMEKSFLNAPGLCGAFATYYKELLKGMYPDMIDLYKFDIVQATEMDGTAINNPKAMTYKDLVAYVNSKGYPINISMFSQRDLRNEVVLYEQDPNGQKKLQEIRQKAKGSQIEITNAIMSRINPVRRLDNVEALPKAKKLPVGA